MRWQSPERWRKERLDPRNKEFRCSICTERYPTTLLRFNDGHPVCAPNCYDKETSTERTTRAAESYAKAAARDAQNRPPQWNSDLLADVAFLQTISSSAGVWPYAPVELSRGGAAVAVTLEGRGFSAADSIEYGEGISDAASPVITDTEVTLSVEADGSMEPGRYPFTFNGNIFRDLFRVV